MELASGSFRIFKEVLSIFIFYSLSFPPDYVPWDIINKIQVRLESLGIECTSHCSLNVCREGDCGKGCGRLKFKLGIDCAGNVFACAWAGYLSGFENVISNPFYIGNLLEMDLKNMLSEAINQNQNFKKMSKFNAQFAGHCPLISYAYNRKDPNKNADPLGRVKRP